MNKRDALRLKPGAIILIGYSSRSSGGAQCFGRVKHVTPNGGILAGTCEYDGYFKERALDQVPYAGAKWFCYSHVIGVVSRGRAAA